MRNCLVFTFLWILRAVTQHAPRDSCARRPLIVYKVARRAHSVSHHRTHRARDGEGDRTRASRDLEMQGAEYWRAFYTGARGGSGACALTCAMHESLELYPLTPKLEVHRPCTCPVQLVRSQLPQTQCTRPSTSTSRRQASRAARSPLRIGLSCTRSAPGPEATGPPSAGRSGPCQRRRGPRRVCHRRAAAAPGARSRAEVKRRARSEMRSCVALAGGLRVDDRGRPCLQTHCTSPNCMCM